MFALRPDYRALLLAVDGLVPGRSEDSDALLQAAETSPPRTEQQPQRARHCWSPRIGPARVNRLTNLYNAVSCATSYPRPEDLPTTPVCRDERSSGRTREAQREFVRLSAARESRTRMIANPSDYRPIGSFDRGNWPAAAPHTKNGSSTYIGRGEARMYVYFHGAKAPQVKRTARIRLEMAACP